MTDRLDSQSLDRLDATIETPDYDRSAVTGGIVHLGIGAFHRAHMAAYVDKVLAAEPEWGIVGASLRRPDTRTALEPQDYLYCLLGRETKRTQARVIGSVIDIVDASGSSRDLVARMADPAIRIVSITVTEKGYCHDPREGGLDASHPDIVHDLGAGDRPRSIPGVIVGALGLRRARGLPGVTVLSCDNLPGNGHVTQRIILDYARLFDPDLADWIAVNARFPSTMVDRIVPATSQADRDEVSALLGVTDAWPVVTEAFSQWIVEDDFIAGRPDWERFGVQMVSDVAPFEAMKLRMLNGSHSTLAYMGSLCGFTLVSEASIDPALRETIERMLAEEVCPTLDVPGIDLGAYRQDLLDRFANRALAHRLEQIAMDGSQKLPQRLIAPLLERAEAGQSFHYLALAVAGWIAFVLDALQKGKHISDPLAAKLEATSRAAGDADKAVETFLAIGDVFPPRLTDNEAIRAAIRDHLETILTKGASAAIDRALSR